MSFAESSRGTYFGSLAAGKTASKEMPATIRNAARSARSRAAPLIATHCSTCSDRGRREHDPDNVNPDAGPVETARAHFERKVDRLGRARLPDRGLDGRHLGRRLEGQRGRVEPPPQILRLDGQPFAQCLHGVSPRKGSDAFCHLLAPSGKS
jgi:hypothetical protein